MLSPESLVQCPNKLEEDRPIGAQVDAPPEERIKTNVDASRRQCTKLASISYVMRDNRLNVIMAKSKRLGDCSILAAKCLAMKEAILKVIQKRSKRIIL